MAIPGDTGVSKVPGMTVFQALGFDDKNKNGIIENKFLKWKQEGYKEEADLNRDGKIVEAEAKFYLWYYSGDKPEIKNKYPITKGDQNILLGIFQKQLKTARLIKEGSLIKERSSWYRSSRLFALAQQMATAGLFNEALTVGQEINDPEVGRDDLYGFIAEKMASAGLYKEALKVGQAINDPEDRFDHLCSMAKMMTSSGLDNEARRVAKKALQVEREIFNETKKVLILPEDEVEELKYLASRMMELGYIKESQALYREALETAAKIRYAEKRLNAIYDIIEIAQKNSYKQVLSVAHKVLNAACEINGILDFPVYFMANIEKIALKILKAGYHKEALKLYKNLLKIYRAIEDPSERSEALSQLADIMAGTGLLRPIGARYDTIIVVPQEIYTEALKVAKEIEVPRLKWDVLGQIAENMARIGLYKEALPIALEIEDSKQRTIPLKVIAEKMRDAGLYKEALKTAQEMGDSREKWWTTKFIISEISGLDLLKQALGVARAMPDLEHKADLICGIASRMEKLGFYKEALKAFKESLEITVQINIKDKFTEVNFLKYYIER